MFAVASASEHFAADSSAEANSDSISDFAAAIAPRFSLMRDSKSSPERTEGSPSTAADLIADHRMSAPILSEP